MTIRELCEWATKNDALDLDIEIQNSEGEGDFLMGVRDCWDPNICDKEHNYHTNKVVVL